MALFNKIFSSSKRKNVDTSIHSQNTSRFPFKDEQVRIILYRECDWRGRRLLFDSGAIQRVPISSNTNTNAGFIEIKDGFGYMHTRSETDNVNFEEMIFGSVAMSFRGAALKVHWLRSPTRVLSSQVFLSPVRTSTFPSNLENNTTGSDTSSVNSFSLSVAVCVPHNLSNLGDKTSTNPLQVPPPSQSMSNGRYVAYSADDSGYGGTDPYNMSLHNPYSFAQSSISSMSSEQDNYRKLSIDSTISEAGNQKNSGINLHRRILKNLSTSFENKSSINDFIGYIRDNLYNTNEPYVSRRRNSELGGDKYNAESDGNVKSRIHMDAVAQQQQQHHSCPGSQNTYNKHTARRAKLGLAVCITFNEADENEMKIFCSEHISLIESMLCRLRAVVETAYINRQNFFQIMIKGWQSTVTWITDLFTAPRLDKPIWLTLSSANSNNPDNIAQNFMSELCWLLASADTKDTNFFISTLLTAILTNHLGWVGTVAPLINTLPDSGELNMQSNKISDISKSYPYSALWAQIGDLYGSIGNPPKISKTIICGRHGQILHKILNVLTYFIRCGEIKRDHKEHYIDKDIIRNIMSNINDSFGTHPQATQSRATSAKKLTVANDSGNGGGFGGITRTATCVKDLSILMNNTSDNDSNNNDYQFKKTDINSCSNNNSNSEIISDKNINDVIKLFRKNVMNDIPNVVAYRDSRFVKQELRIGNLSMDTGIEMNQKLKTDLKTYQIKTSRTINDKIKLTLTNPDNVEYNIVTSLDESGNLVTPTVGNALNSTFLWEIKPIAEGISLEKGVEITEKEDTVGIEMCTQPKLSELILSNSIGTNKGRLLWIEPIKEENMTLELIKHLEKTNEAAKSSICDDPLKSLITSTAASNNVVFVLGEDEELVDLKHQTREIQAAMKKEEVTPDEPPKKICKHKFKKHSGVKFNFEQYPQIATTYMKNKNLDISNYNFLEKGLRIEKEMKMNGGASTSTFTTTKTEECDNDACDCGSCSGNSNESIFLTTPSNASELEYSCDLNENNNYQSTMTNTTMFATPSNASELNYSQDLNDYTSGVKDRIGSGLNKLEKKSIDEMATKSDRHNRDETLASSKLSIISIPMPKSRTKNKEKSNPSCNAGSMLISNPGFIPSLFIGISDHYIPDMVLQGVSIPPIKWEPSLKNDLVLASHCAILDQTPTENVAIIGNIDNWEVRLVSSQTYVLQTGPVSGGPVGMSQLVASMLETVHAMWGAGTSAYHCMSYMESKLQEMYFQSETLAAFLLDTEFCSLNKLTSALNLSANDVPLLMSVASIHTPQVTKKYGISFR